eukprot:scaffold37028_cov57-Attheya_sp.AAC.3
MTGMRTRMTTMTKIMKKMITSKVDDENTAIKSITLNEMDNKYHGPRKNAYDLKGQGSQEIIITSM